MTASNDRWWRNKCAIYADKLGDWIRSAPRNSKSVMQVGSIRESLLKASKMHYDEQAYDELQAIDAYVLSDQHTKRVQDTYTKLCR